MTDLPPAVRHELAELRRAGEGAQQANRELADTIRRLSDASTDPTNQ